MAATKIALVTGGSRGLGKNMATSLAGKGIDVLLTYRSNETEAKQTVKEIEQLGRKATALQLDMSDFSSLNDFVVRVKQTLQSNWNTDHFDFLVNNAGMGATIPFEKVTEEIFNDFLNVHFKSVYFLTQKLVPHINANGCIINISTGIRANVVAPGPIETDFNSAAIRNNAQMKERLSSLSPLGRVGNADDIGSVVAFLCSGDAKWINGQRIEVSGGINV